MRWIDEIIYKWRVANYKGKKRKEDQNDFQSLNVNTDFIDEIEEYLDEVSLGLKKLFAEDKRKKKIHRRQKYYNKKKW